MTLVGDGWASRGGALGGGGTVACGPMGVEGKWAGPRETVPGGGGKLIRIQNFKRVQINSNSSKL
jgi:hypothetical protein